MNAPVIVADDAGAGWSFRSCHKCRVVAFLLVLGGMVFVLRQQGRIWWCACGDRFAASWDIWSQHNSQHLVDPYSFSHVLHGVIFFGLLHLVAPRMSIGWQLWWATLLESSWEVLENSQWIIQRYREATISLGYEGDSVLNSLSDVGCCMLGFYIAKRLGLIWSILFFVVLEIACLYWIRDNLTLNVLMLIHPVDAIRAWQMQGAPH